MSETDLLPCPFNHDATVATEPPFAVKYSASEGWSVACETCGSEGPREATETNAIAAWNTRSARPVSEREQIVAWLRDIENHANISDWAWAKHFADAIERGDHLGETS